MFYNKLKGMNAYARHKVLIHDYLTYYRGTIPTNIPTEYKTERDILNEEHQFVRTPSEIPQTWEQRIAKKYYDQLFKEYTICDLRKYKEGKIALRWRIEKEVVSGKGQFMCASTSCDATENLQSWEVNFKYIEKEKQKNELVKVRLCPSCSDKLNFRKQNSMARKRDRSEEISEGSKRPKVVSSSRKKVKTESVSSGEASKDCIIISDDEPVDDEEYIADLLQ
ncbi:folate-sensitive fragile site protein Fra10Ac1-domain-containing protein [Pilobolus umbonatus]|nr:folate-sensitive fragile site protein Fra10Ac1-domain-containing protein [Pilobolus umbonatus]